jgi:hypothetical protein
VREGSREGMTSTLARHIKYEVQYSVLRPSSFLRPSFVLPSHTSVLRTVLYLQCLVGYDVRLSRAVRVSGAPAPPPTDADADARRPC